MKYAEVTSMVEERAELLYRVLWPYIQEIISQVLNETANLKEATTESLAEIICYRTALTVRKMVREMNEGARGGEIERLRELIRKDPDLASKASKYVAKHLKCRIKRLIESEISRMEGH
jgi:hypothetical protein